MRQANSSSVTRALRLPGLADCFGRVGPLLLRRPRAIILRPFLLKM